MPGALLYYVYLAVMATGLACFLQAYRRRFDTPVHRRWGLGGAGVSVTGIVVVLLGAELGGWRVAQRWPDVVSVHRVVALVAAALLLLTVSTGLLRIPIHTRLYKLFLPAYALALLTAGLGYQP